MQNKLQITLHNLLWLTSALPPVSGRHFFPRVDGEDDDTADDEDADEGDGRLGSHREGCRHPGPICRQCRKTFFSGNQYC
jgi:hypothetical protein